MYKNILSVSALFVVISLKSQTVFMDKVSIEFAKTFSFAAMAKEVDTRWYDAAKDRMAKEVISYFNFTGDANKSLYKRTKEPVVRQGTYFSSLADNNIVYNDYLTQTTVSQKPMYEENYLVQDSLLNIKWKITADTRMIAGFECRKAVGILYDTIAVFAFYTDEIMINGGPEGINGLPGMILGVGIPRLHTTWFATKVQILDAGELRAVTPVTKGKKTSRSEMVKAVSGAMKNWGPQGQMLLLGLVI